MSIIQLPLPIAANTGVVPNIKTMTTTDSLATITTAGYMNQYSLEGYPLATTDVLHVLYSFNTTTNVGTFGIFTVSISNGVITLVEDVTASEVTYTAPSIANAMAIFTNTTGNISDNIAANNVVTTSSATPGTIRAIKGQMAGTATTMTSGNLVGVRGEVDCVGASGGFLYGAQGKVIPSGTLSGSSWTAGVFGQLDISAATINAGQTACLWGDYGATSHTLTDTSGMRGVAMTNTTAAVLNAQDYRYGNATYLLELAGAGGTLNYYAAAGTSAGSAGDATHCAAQQVIKIEINGVAAFIPVFTQNT